MGILTVKLLTGFVPQLTSIFYDMIFEHLFVEYLYMKYPIELIIFPPKEEIDETPPPSNVEEPKKQAPVARILHLDEPIAPSKLKYQDESSPNFSKKPSSLGKEDIILKRRL